MINITNKELEIIINIIKKHAKNCDVIVFGSRLKGNNRQYSDLDLAFICENGLDFKTITKLDLAFEKSDLPYRVDIIDYNNASNEFKKIIDKNYEKIYNVNIYYNDFGKVCQF